MRAGGWLRCDGCDAQEPDPGGAMPLDGWITIQELCNERFCEGHPRLYCSEECRLRKGMRMLSGENISHHGEDYSEDG